MNERNDLVRCIRGELVGPSAWVKEVNLATFSDRVLSDPIPLRRGPLGWRPTPQVAVEEVLYYERESPHRKYGIGLLHPDSVAGPDELALQVGDTLGVDGDGSVLEVPAPNAAENDSGSAGELEPTANIDDDDFDISNPDIRHPSTIGISFCARLTDNTELIVRLPQEFRFPWQADAEQPWAVNGRYDRCTRRWLSDDGTEKEAPIWRRISALFPNTEVVFLASELRSRRVITKDVPMPPASPIRLRVDVFPRKETNRQGVWLITVVLRNVTRAEVSAGKESVLYQTLFEVAVRGGQFEPYPESARPFEQLDSDEQSLALLYRSCATWGIGHGCAAGWRTVDEDGTGVPPSIFADVLPTVQLPSMTPDIEIEGRSIDLSMRALASLPMEGSGGAWDSLEQLERGYRNWIDEERKRASALSSHLRSVAMRHLDACESCCARIRNGIETLKQDQRVLRAFKLANLAMLLQQIATKQLSRRPLTWVSPNQGALPSDDHRSPWHIFLANSEDAKKVGAWRAFQLAFLLMSIRGMVDVRSADRSLVDLIWFPTGGGKTEAYLALMAFHMFHQRLIDSQNDGDLRRDGTNVLMRYTLRMLTTQQFQRAAGLIVAMEYLRRHPEEHGFGGIPGSRFSLGLWIGGDGSPNKISDAKREYAHFRAGDNEGNPLVLTECPWCRAEIGRFKAKRPPSIPKEKWNALVTRGISNDGTEGPRLLCPDSLCEYGQEASEQWLPIEVVDERIYRYPPSLVIATADKLAMMSYKPEAGRIFGRELIAGESRQFALPPTLLVQDELHLISGPLGSMYALYEGIFEALCSFQDNGTWIKPKIVASTATIRGAGDQVKALYGRSQTQLFPPPSLTMGNSFFGKYARDENGKLRDGRLYVGIHATEYGSVLTTQVRAFASALFRPWAFTPERRDAWWTLLAFYNSIRELGGAKTLFDSDIRSRLKFMFNREGFAEDRRNLRIVEELTSRLSQAEIVRMMDRLSIPYTNEQRSELLDACLASNIIEVGVDIDRLSLMGVVGQPKTTATYIQVTGRVGRRWWERPGLILTIYSPAKSRDRSHYEQFYSYHMRLYERVEPTTATPFSVSAVQRGFVGALLAWARQCSSAPVQARLIYSPHLRSAFDILRERCEAVQTEADLGRSLAAMDISLQDMERKWSRNPQEWQEFPPKTTGEYLLLWPGQYYTGIQKQNGVFVPSSMRQVDRSAELEITLGYAAAFPRTASNFAGGDVGLQRDSETTSG